MKKKVVSVLLAVCVIGTTVLAGCGSSDSGSTTTEDTSAAETADSSEAGGSSEDADSDASSSTGQPAEAGVIELKEDKVFRVGYVNIDNSDSSCYPAAVNFQEYVQTEEFAEAVGADKVEAMIADSALDIEKQSTNIETMLTKGVDMMFIVGVDTEGNTAGVEACNAEGVPVFMVGTEASGGEWRFIGFDEEEFGYMQGQWCVDNLEENAKICYIEGTAGREATIKRKAGFEKAIAERDDLEIISSQPGDFESATAMQVTEDWITKYGDEIACIAAADDKMANGAASAVAQNNLSDQIAVVGVVQNQDNLSAMEDGSWDGAILCDWPSIGLLCGEVAKAVYNGETIESRTNITLGNLSAENYEDTIKELTTWMD